ncbi:pyridoxamine 5'-phosphate oxidase [Mesorhizobium sp. NBSH29]|nr:pyridoxamine 5'-phosphate oxidase [Mesorhizobium sp. NBSH29]
MLPYHADELEAQALAGGGSGGGAIRGFMPDQHREFFAMLPYVFAAAADDEGWPHATVLTGEPGFIRSPDAATLDVGALPGPADPLLAGFAVGRPIGLLGIDLATRRRNRVNGFVERTSASGFALAINQSFGNCPKYIQVRSVRRGLAQPGKVEELAVLDADARALIAASDTFFVASRSRDVAEAPGGLDVSHRGGRPGFVGVEGDVLTVPDFSGNRYYNTLGNLLGDPRAGLLFIDFERGDMLQLQGTVEIDWTANPALRGAERSWRFQVRRGWRRRGALGLRWRLVEASPFTLATGLWDADTVSGSTLAR